MSRELEYWQKRAERFERELMAAREEIGRLKGPVFVDEAERTKWEAREERR